MVQKITSKGLGERLGEQVTLMRQSSSRDQEIRGTLVYYPNRFAILPASSKSTKRLVPIKEGYLVGILCTSHPDKLEYFRDYLYKPNNPK